MPRVKDLWVNADGTKTARHPDNGGNKNAKHYLAIWHDPDGNETTKVFARKGDARKHADKMEADASRGEYLDPKAAKERFGPLAEKYLRMRRKRDGSKPGEATRIRTMSVYRHHVEPKFGNRLVQSVKASEIVEWLQGPLSEMSGGVQESAFHIVAGTFDLAVADKLRKDNPARAKVVKAPVVEHSPRKAWPVEQAWEVRDELPDPYRLVIDLGAGLGCRASEMFGLAVDDFDFEAEQVHIRRQARRVGKQVVFKLPKEARQRTVPLPRGVAVAVEAHLAKFPAADVELPWMDEEGNVGDPVTARLVLAWQPGKRRYVAGQPLAAGNFVQGIWKPALSRVGIIPEPEKTEWHTLVYRVGDARGNGMHVLRHVYEAMLGDGGVSLAGMMEFMGHSRKSQGVTIGTYGHATEETFQRGLEAVDGRLYKLRSVSSGGTVTELGVARALPAMPRAVSPQGWRDGARRIWTGNLAV